MIYTIVITDTLTAGITDKPARPHKNKRIAKKWLKRYGYKKIPDDNIYVTADNKIIMHPVTYRKFIKSFGTAADAEAAIIKYFVGGKEHGGTEGNR